MLNIQDGRVIGLEQAIRAVKRGGFDIMLMTEKKIQTEEYSHNRLGYNVICSTVRPSKVGGSQGNVGLVSRDRPNTWDIESTHFHRPNVVICKIVTGCICIPLVSATSPPPPEAQSPPRP